MHTKPVPVFNSSGNDQWPTVRNWFSAHSFSKTEPHFVNNVKFSKTASLFVTSTNFGEVKLWDNKNCHPVGILNSPDYNPSNIIGYIKKSKKTKQLLNNVTVALNKTSENLMRVLKANIEFPVFK